MKHSGFDIAFLHPRYWLLWFGLGLLWLITQLPYKVLLRLGRALGVLMQRVAHSRRHIVTRNIELCFTHLSDAERDALVRENFASMGIAFFEMAMS